MNGNCRDNILIITYGKSYTLDEQLVLSTQDYSLIKG